MTEIMGLNDRSILVVDDEPDLKELIAEVFRTTGFRVYEADSGQSAYEIFKSEPIDAVISDVRMPKGDGLWLFENIQKFRPGFRRFWLMTAFADLNRELAIQRGVRNLILKPFDINQLIAEVESAMKADE